MCRYSPRPPLRSSGRRCGAFRGRACPAGGTHAPRRRYRAVITLDVVIPSLGRSTLVRTLDSLALGTTRPDCVTIVSNEVGAEVVAAGLDARVVRFESDRYPYGDRDVALRRNVGIFSSRCSHVLTFDDDQIAPRSMIE